MNLPHAALAFLMLTVTSPAPPAKVFISPDRALRAVVWTGSTGESRVQIQTHSGLVMLTRDGTSGDGSHGYGVVHAEWTADSQFFVAGTEAAGGHQPWAHPIWIYSRAKNRVFELEKMRATAVADFTLKPPDVIEMKALACENVKGNLQSRSVIVSLHQLASAERLAAAPCPAQ